MKSEEIIMLAFLILVVVGLPTFLYFLSKEEKNRL
jgi:hypothetical protein